MLLQNKLIPICLSARIASSWTFPMIPSSTSKVLSNKSKTGRTLSYHLSNTFVPKYGASSRLLSTSSDTKGSAFDAASTVLIGFGCPLRSMGWYHAHQLLQKNLCPSASLDYVVEPWYMTEAGKQTPGWDEFDAFRKETEEKEGILFFGKVSEVPPPKEADSPRMAIISTRTADMPKHFSECIKIGCKTIYLEKPGAPTVPELEAMRDEAAEAGVSVFMGFNKNVAKFSTKTMEFASKTPGSQITFVHNNAYENTLESLGECFERCAEGMLKNMAIHELALLVTFYDVSVENIEEVVADKEYSSCQTLVGPSGESFTDFDKIKFAITTKKGITINVQADRCGGDDSVGIVTDVDGNVLFEYSMPDDEEREDIIPSLEKQLPGAMPYFYVQHPDYITLKERVAKYCADGTPAHGVASIDVALETLKVAEYLTPILQKQLT
mmetsp:Transcript_1605/g.2279  ORF Transcript_1605/g.2279 Transcript_1605/m.2279 type:complete len:439 (+) Transcript_1605:38-1354(+)